MSDRVGYWQRMVASLEASGLSRAKYCRRRRLNYHTLTYWVKRPGHSTDPPTPPDPARPHPVTHTGQIVPV